MKCLLVLLNLLLLVSVKGLCQQKAVIANTGEEVELYDDGTWKYVHSDTTGSVKLDTIILSKPRQSDYLIKSEKLDVGIWLNKKQWSYSKNEKDEESPAEYSFTLTGEDAYGMIITERIPIPIESLLNIAIQNAQSAASNVRVVKEECRQINGTLVHYMQMEGTIQGIEFVYLGYYYSNENGCIQFLTYTAKSLLKDYQEDMEDLLNGFVTNP